MTLQANEIEGVAAACEAAGVALEQLAHYAGEWIAPDLAERLRKVHTVNADADGESAATAVCRALLARVNEVGTNAGFEFCLKLYERIDYAPDFTATLSAVLADWEARQPNLQGLTVSRDFYQNERAFLKVLLEDYPRVCCLVSKTGGGEPLGTGFLIATDLVVTAQHVIDRIQGPFGRDQVPHMLRAVFDFTSGSLPRELKSDGRLLVARLHPDDWDVCHSEAYDRDGVAASPSTADLEQHSQRLDFAVLRLATPVGQTSPPDRKTQARGWFEIANLSDTDYWIDVQIAVPQHPSGLPRLFQTGRIKTAFACKTRIRHSAQTADGSSGAPCLVPGKGLIAMHNAAHKVAGQTVANQAIRFDAVLRKLGNQPPHGGPGDRLRPWAVSRQDGEIAPIIGRRGFLDWMLYGLETEPDVLTRRDRILAVETEGDDDAGLTFSSEIAQTVLEHASGQRLVTLDESACLPGTAEAFALALGLKLGVPRAALLAPPPRPGTELPAGAEDGDKLDRWSSQLMPNWFLGLLSDALSQGGTAPWQDAWIMIDRIDDMPLSAEVANFIAGIIESDTDERATTATAKRLRWAFLGLTPRFLTEADVTTETIDPTRVTREQLLETLVAANAERALGLSAAVLEDIANRYAVALDVMASAGVPDLVRHAQEIVAREIDSQIALQSNGAQMTGTG